MLEGQESVAVALRIPANTPVVLGLSAQRVIPLAPGRAIARNALLRSVWLVIAWQLFADPPQFFMGEFDNSFSAFESLRHILHPPNTPN
jgi:hypothetical protein